jgi:hypothetical protein
MHRIIDGKQLKTIDDITFGNESHVTFSRCNISADAFRKICSRKYDELSLRGNTISADGYQYLSNLECNILTIEDNMSEKCQYLTGKYNELIFLYGCGITPLDCKHFSRKNLHTLNLCGSYIGDEGCKYLAENRYEILELMSIGLTSAGCIHLNKIKCKILDISHNNIEDGYKYLTCNTYDRLDLSSCNITNLQFIGNIKCKKLYLSSNTISDCKYLCENYYDELYLPNSNDYNYLKQLRCGRLYIYGQHSIDVISCLATISCEMIIFHDCHYKDTDLKDILQISCHTLVSYTLSKLDNVETPTTRTNFFELRYGDKIFAKQISKNYILNMDFEMSKSIKLKDLRQIIIDYYT